MLKILMIGDIYGEPGRKALERFVVPMKQKGEADFVVANCENSAGGSGVTPAVARELFQNGCDVLTGGDHFFDKRQELEEYAGKETRLLRPVNYPQAAFGHGSCVVECKGVKIGVLHAAGQVFMRYAFDSPFFAADDQLKKWDADGMKVRIVDFHAEATSEKVAFSWYVDGRVSAVGGTHTHIQTADERVTAAGTACISDLGMTGPYDSVIGAEKGPIIQRFLTQTPLHKTVAKNDVRLCGALIHIDERSGRAISIERIQKKLE